MRILHLNSIAGIASTLAGEQNQRGHHAEVWDWKKHPNNYGGVKLVSRLATLNIPNEKWDVVHCHSCSLFPLGLERLFNFRDAELLYHHHGSDVRYKSCGCPKWGKPHLVSTPDLARWCPNALYVPNPIVNAEYAINNEPYVPIQKLPKKPQAEFLKDLQAHDKLVDLPSELLGVASYSAMQAQALGCKVYERVPYPQEVGHVCDLLDYVYERLL